MCNDKCNEGLASQQTSKIHCTYLSKEQFWPDLSKIVERRDGVIPQVFVVPNGFLDAAFRCGQALLAEMYAVTPPKGLGSVHIRAAVVDEVTFRRVRDPRLFQSLGCRQDLTPTDGARTQYLIVIIFLGLA